MNSSGVSGLILEGLDHDATEFWLTCNTVVAHEANQFKSTYRKLKNWFSQALGFQSKNLASNTRNRDIKENVKLIHTPLNGLNIW